MKKYKYLLYLSMSFAALEGCKKEDFVKSNTNPETLYTIDPENEFLNVATQIHGQDFEAYYDYYRRIMPWMQMNTAQAGNSKTLVTDVGNFNSRYGILFPTLGAQVADLNHLIDLMPEAQQAGYVYMRAIADIPKIYYSFYVSDINGSIPFTEAFLARYGGTTTPKYETQQELFGLFDTRLKEIVTTLKTSQTATQVSLGSHDLYFGGEVSNWIKAANALRLRIALRLTKRDETTAKTIITDVLSDANQMASNADGWVFRARYSFATNGSNWDITTFRAPRPTVDFMIKNADPRIRNFYEKNNYTQANLETAIAKGVYPAGTKWNSQQYVGATTSPDSALGKYKNWFATKTVPDVTPALVLDTISYLKRRMWTPDYNSGTGTNTMPVITYADYCFMRAEIAARGYSTSGGSAEQWYNAGIEASIAFFDDAAKKAVTEDYTAVTADEVTAYKNSADVKFNASKALEQIAVQSFLNFYKQPNEAWALYKRTGMPNSSTALANENIVIDGAVKAIPRRAALSLPATTDPNYANKQAALDAMAADADFGSGPTDLFGRVWWDKK